MTAVSQYCRAHQTACPTNTPVRTVVFDGKIIRRTWGGGHGDVDGNQLQPLAALYTPPHASAAPQTPSQACTVQPSTASHKAPQVSTSNPLVQYRPAPPVHTAPHPFSTPPQPSTTLRTSLRLAHLSTTLPQPSATALIHRPHTDPPTPATPPGAIQRWTTPWRSVGGSSRGARRCASTSPSDCSKCNKTTALIWRRSVPWASSSPWCPLSWAPICRPCSRMMSPRSPRRRPARR